ncbi:MAG: flagellin [Crenarchaeota archaeon]|nr:MAG: flagellin [Thermoproteota archaeon]RDJ34539.1 MAG: flagellin [Thermoproteota archaeon]RDJ35941.1 MAG: flagellin [Thermoproteota archaeon]RDJ38518.1 MAG: flagellin [Thermoproteota archaeon]
MNLIRKGHGHTHRGVIGVESAIVMIAFVIVAAALAFVVLNMGFATTQKAKTSIISGLGEASSSLEISGKVTGIGNVGDARLDVVSIPLKIASGGNAVNLQNTTASVKYLSNTVEYDNILVGTASTSTNAINVTEGWELANRHFNVVDVPANPVNGTWTGGTKAIFYWTVGAGNQILDEGEHAVLSIAFDQSPEERPAALDRIRAEILLPTGSPLTIERDVPNITNTVVDLG